MSKSIKGIVVLHLSFGPRIQAVVSVEYLVDAGATKFEPVDILSVNCERLICKGNPCNPGCMSSIIEFSAKAGLEKALADEIAEICMTEWSGRIADECRADYKKRRESCIKSKTHREAG